jgi:hypothetical protein
MKYRGLVEFENNPNLKIVKWVGYGKFNKVGFLVDFFKNDLSKQQQLAVLTDIVDMEYSQKTKKELIKILSGGFK